MNFDFPTILFLASVITGLIWLADILLWKPQRKEQDKEPVIVEYARSFFPIILIVLLLRSFLFEPFRIPSGSMMPTLLAGDFILVNKYAYGIRLPVINKKILDIDDPQRGDVAVFRYPADPSTDYIKRVIGLPGDRIEYRDKMLYINGKQLNYKQEGIYIGMGSGVNYTGTRISDETIDNVRHKILIRTEQPEYTYPCMQEGRLFEVPEGHYFVMGDNRDYSNDSRFWCAVPDENLVGKAFMIWMHWDSEGNGLDTARIGQTIE
jgi:signal peptidase I